MASTDLPRGQIQSDLIRLRDSIGGLQANKVSGVSFAVKSAKDLGIKLRDGADELTKEDVENAGRLLGMVQAGAVVKSDVSVVWVGITKNKNGVDQLTVLVSAQVTVRFESADGSYRDFVGSGHGSDTSDKALGKAETYAWKAAICKGLCLPDAEMHDTDDESVPIQPTKADDDGFLTPAPVVPLRTTSIDVAAIIREVEATTELNQLTAVVQKYRGQLPDDAKTVVGNAIAKRKARGWVPGKLPTAFGGPT